MAEQGIGISAFLDEGVSDWQVKGLGEQMIVGQALGLKWWTPRFIYDPLSRQNKNLVDLTEGQVKAVIEISKSSGFSIACLGTAVGKEKLSPYDDDRNPAPYTTPEQSTTRMQRALYVADWADARFIRGFSFYGKLGEDPNKYYQQALDRIGTNVRLCEEAHRIYLMELETNLVARNADIAIKLCHDIGSPYLLVCTDNANSHVQGLINPFEEFRKIVDAGILGYMHIKDFSKPCDTQIIVDEEALQHFCSVKNGKAQYESTVQYLAKHWQGIDEKLRQLGAPGLMSDIEGHMKGGGQFGGDSGPDGIGVALRAYTSLLAQHGVPYILRTDADIVKRPIQQKG